MRDDGEDRNRNVSLDESELVVGSLDVSTAVPVQAE